MQLPWNQLLTTICVCSHGPGPVFNFKLSSASRPQHCMPGRSGVIWEWSLVVLSAGLEQLTRSTSNKQCWLHSTSAQTPHCPCRREGPEPSAAGREASLSWLVSKAMWWPGKGGQADASAAEQVGSRLDKRLHVHRPWL